MVMKYYLRMIFELEELLNQRKYLVKPLITRIQNSPFYTPDESFINELFQKHCFELLEKKELLELESALTVLQWSGLACSANVIHLIDVLRQATPEAKSEKIKEKLSGSIGFYNELYRFRFYHELAELSIAIQDYECVELTIQMINEVNSYA
jgi:hypothetical protein